MTDKSEKKRWALLIELLLDICSDNQTYSSSKSEKLKSLMNEVSRSLK